MRGGSLKLPFVAALATSAFLLFTLELFAGREVLPVFGGAPGVWATALCFFSGMLFLGYGYAHLSVTRLGTKRGGLVHLVLAIVLVAVSTQAPTTVASLRIEGAPEALNVLWALLVIAGPPAFLLASTTPLLSAWFAGTSARRMVALRRVQRREPPGPPGVPIPDRASAAAVRPARRAPHRPRRLRPAAGGDRRSSAPHQGNRRRCHADGLAPTPAMENGYGGAGSCGG